jgi:hypothetical protein
MTAPSNAQAALEICECWRTSASRQVAVLREKLIAHVKTMHGQLDEKAAERLGGSLSSLAVWASTDLSPTQWEMAYTLVCNGEASVPKAFELARML